jgi:hypothetical protein
MRLITIETNDELLATSLTYLASRANAQVVTNTIAEGKVEIAAVEEPAKEPKKTATKPAKVETATAPAHTLTELKNKLNAKWQAADNAGRKAIAALIAGYSTDRSVRPQMVPEEKRDALYTQLDKL